VTLARAWDVYDCAGTFTENSVRLAGNKSVAEPETKLFPLVNHRRSMTSCATFQVDDKLFFNKSFQADAFETRFDLFPYRERHRLNGKDNAIMLN
jgi:hypothetical protein